jgi:WhiB family redox-sensing transcriptional regulator
MRDSVGSKKVRSSTNYGFGMDLIYQGASCSKGEYDPEWWFEDSDPSLAKKICGECPVAQECLKFAIDEKINFGVWGGLTGDERMKIRRKR